MVHMYIFMYVCMHVCMYACIHLYMFVASMFIRVCMYEEYMMYFVGNWQALTEHLDPFGTRRPLVNNT